jgi:hypothetical protein
VGKVEPYLLARATTAVRRVASAAESGRVLGPDDQEETP